MRRVHTLVVGAGPGGLAAAAGLARAGVEVLVVEKNPVVGPKLCGGYLPWNHETREMGIPAEVIEKSYSELVVRINRQELRLPDEPKITFSRAELGAAMAAQARAAGAVIETGRRFRGVEGHAAWVDDEPIRFDYLIGADGSNSTVRRMLRLPVRSYLVAFQVNLPEVRGEIEYLFDFDRYSCWPAWIIPHRDHTVVGVGGDPKLFPLSKMKRELRELVQRLGHPSEKLSCRGFRLATDYAGHVFGQIYLVGDAAGLVGDWDGGGIYAAWASGVEAAHHILSPAQGFPRVEAILAAKRHQHRVLRALTVNRTLRRGMLALLPLAFKVFPVRRRFFQRLHPRAEESE